MNSRIVSIALLCTFIALSMFSTEVKAECKLGDGSKGGPGCVACLKDTFHVCDHDSWVKRPCGKGTTCKITGHCQATCG